MATPRGKPKLPARLLARPLATLRGMRKLQVTLLATKLPAKQLVRPLATLAACGE